MLLDALGHAEAKMAVSTSSALINKYQFMSSIALTAKKTSASYAIARQAEDHQQNQNSGEPHIGGLGGVGRETDAQDREKERNGWRSNTRSFYTVQS